MIISSFLNVPTLSVSDRIVDATNVTLRCDAGSQIVTTYMFYREQKSICFEPHVSCRGSFLDFTPISENDGGSYTCTIQNPVSTNSSDSLSLTVAVPVSAVTLTSNTSDLFLWPGRDSASLRCSSNGTDVTYFWSLDGAALPQDPQYQLTLNNSILIISSISTKDNGYFMCTARNWINSENSSRLYLNLASPISAVTLTSNISTVLWAGEDSVSLHCSAQGSAITFSWSLHGEPVSPNPPYSLTQIPVSAVTLTSNNSDLLLWPGRDSASLRCSSNGTDVTYSWSLNGAELPQDPQYQLTLNNSILIISPISAKDNGYFMCTARNWMNSENSSRLFLNLASPVSAVTLSSNTSEVLWAGEDSASLHCSAQGSVITFSWSLNGNQVLSKPPYSITQSDSPPNSTLTISPVSRHDAGPFTCTASNLANSETSNAVNLTLGLPVSSVTLTSTTSDLLLWLGRDSASLRCSSNGTDVTYSWSLDGAALPQDPQYQLTLNNSMLIINPISAMDNGYFMCTARNWMNSENSSRLYLNLASPVSAVTLTSNTSEVLWAGDDSVSLHCSAQGSAITFSWSLNGEPVFPNPPYSITESVSPPNSTLTISPVSRHDAGSFTCTASNLANSETSNTLTLTMRPALNAPILSIISDRIVDGTNVTLQCDAGNQNVTSFTFYRDGQKIICSGRVICRGSFLDFTPISENDSRSYTCTIKNSGSTNTSDSLSLIVSVSVSSVTLTSNTSDLLLWPVRDSASLRCSSNGTDVTYSWSLDGAALPQDPQYQLTLNNSMLIISPISAKDNGYFMCTARNWMNSENSGRLYLNLALHSGLPAPTRSVNGTFGGSVYFDVFVDLPDEYRIQWVLGETGDVVVIAEVNPGSVPEYHPQYRGRTQLFQNETLRLDNLTSADKGHYSLYVFNENTFITEIVSYDLKLFLPVSAVTLTSNTSDLLLWPGKDSASLRCSSNGTDVTYSWSLDGAELPQDPQYQLTLNNSMLIISPISTKDNGYFMCMARNWINSENSSRLFLNLALHTGLVTPTRSVNGTFGGSVYFDVFVDLPDEYRIMWVLGETGDVTVIAEVNPGSVPEYHPQYRGRTRLYQNETLRLDNLTSAEEGHYSLYVFNEKTFITEIVSYDLKLFLPVSAVTLTSNTSDLLLWPERDSASLRCSSNGTDVTYSWSLDGAALPQDPQYQLTLNNSVLIISPISTKDNGYFMCTARNWINSENSSRLYLNLALQTGLPLPTRSVNGTFGGSVYFDVFPDLPDEYRIQWVLGETGDVTVIAEVNPGSVPEYHPQYRGRTQLYQNETLRLDNLTSADEGHYSLYVFNVKKFITEIVSYDLKLFLPVSAVTLTSNTSNLLLWPGRDSASLKCSSNGTDVTYSWSLDGAALPQDPQYQLTLNNSMLIISPISTKDNGYFMCTARNWMNSENSSRLYLNLALHTGLPAPTRSVNGTFGGSVYFNVFVDLPDEYRIVWVSGETGDVTVIAEVNPGSVPEYHPQYRGRCELFQNETLRLDNLTSVDEGHYSLYVFNEKNFITEIVSYDLKLYTFLNAPSLSIISDRTVHGTNVTLRCDAGNQEATTYAFYRDGQRIICSEHVICRGSFLDFTPISEKDSGSYTCTIQNPVSANTSDSLSLIVVAPVSAVTLTSNISEVLWAGEDSVSLHCSAQGSAIIFSWSLNGEPVSPNPPYSITQSDSPTNSTLTISPVSRHDAGPFTCTASNLANSETSNTLDLTIRWRPEGNVLCLVTSENDGYVVLGCSCPGGNPPANVTMKLNNTLSTAWTTVTRNISRDHNLQGSNLTCFGDQMGRTSSCTIALEPPHCSTHNNSAIIHIKEGEPVAMRVSLAPGLPAEFTWFHLNPDPVPVTVQAHRQITVESNGSTSTLFLSQARASESGSYECWARNIIGRGTFNFNLRVAKQASGWSGGAVAGIVVGVLLLLFLIAILIFILIRRRARRRKSVLSENQNKR
ncbi:hemicentin-1-like [Ranitomeya variabilis]|uniref:hemicentin-1-like n=1 Tax=Ranitomeya variabilis TaxID=490064 RepID=UPI004056EF63